jgi:cyclic beta-1,2-glucan synthetase
VARQIEYGHQLGIPWGVSESAFIGKFMDGDYRYQSFGVPGLGLKRGLENDRVVAPYATAMAAMIAPREALANFQRLAGEGAEGKFGFYEAIDYTPDRLPHGQRLARRSDATPVPSRAHGPRSRAAPPGADPHRLADRRGGPGLA